jgi:hypothetical protein
MTMLLAVLCALVGGYLYWVPDPASDTTIVEPPKITITNTDTKTVIAMTASKAADNTVKVARYPNGWQIVAPQELAGDNIVIGPAVAAVANLSATSVITPTSSDLSAYGLVPPQYTIITLDNAQQPIDTLLIGSRNPSGGARYVQHVGDSKVYLVSDSTLDTIEGWFGTLPIEPTPLPDVKTPAATPMPDVQTPTP